MLAASAIPDEVGLGLEIHRRRGGGVLCGLAGSPIIVAAR